MRQIFILMLSVACFTGASCGGNHPAEDCPGGNCQPTCESITCDTPPSPKCENEKTLLVYDNQGSCENGQCFYQEKRIQCSNKCKKSIGKIKV
jgi:hypothetical protein